MPREIFVAVVLSCLFVDESSRTNRGGRSVSVRMELFVALLSPPLISVRHLISSCCATSFNLPKRVLSQIDRVCGWTSPKKRRDFAFGEVQEPLSDLVEARFCVLLARIQKSEAMASSARTEQAMPPEQSPHFGKE